MKRVAFLLLLTALPVYAETTHYLVRPVYSSVRFTIIKWGVIKEEGIFREFTGNLIYDPAHPEQGRFDMVVQSASVDTKNDGRDSTLRSSDFFDAERYPTLSFVSRTVARQGSSWVVSGDLTIHGTTRRVHFPVTPLGVRDLPKIGKLAGFETTFNINRRDFSVLGTRWGAIPGVLSDEVEIHIIVGAIRQVR